MKLNKLVLVALMALGAVACDKNDGGDDVATGKKSVVLKINGITSNLSRGTGGETQDDTREAVLKNVTIYFSDGNTIYETRRIAEGEEDWADLTNGENGVIFHNLPAAVSQVHIIGNAQGSVTQYNTVAAMKRHGLNVEDQQDMNNVTMYGADETLAEATITDTEHSGLKLLQADVTLVPCVARIEIGNIECEDLGISFGELDLQVIGLLNFYERVQVDGTNASSMIAVDDVIPYDKTAQGDEIVFGDSEYTPEGWDVITGSNKTLNPENKRFNPAEGRYVYNFIPSADLRVRLNLDAKTAAGAVHPYNTVTAKFTENFTAGKIYKLDFKFQEEALKPWDPDEQLCVNVVVTVQDWEVVTLTPTYE